MVGRNEIIKRLALKKYGTESNIDNRKLQECSQICDFIEEIVTEALLDGEKIAWKGFFSAEITNRRERRGRHPQTNEVVVFPPVKTINCRMSQRIKDMINEK